MMMRGLVANPKYKLDQLVFQVWRINGPFDELFFDVFHAAAHAREKVEKFGPLTIKVGGAVYGILAEIRLDSARVVVQDWDEPLLIRGYRVYGRWWKDPEARRRQEILDTRIRRAVRREIGEAAGYPLPFADLKMEKLRTVLEEAVPPSLQ
jgi:hypothetical protein